MNYQNISPAMLSSGVPRGYEVQRFIEGNTAKIDYSVSSLAINSLGQDPRWLEVEVRRKMEQGLAGLIAKQKMVEHATGYGKAFVLEAVVLSREELYALMTWAAKNPHPAAQQQ